MIDRVVGFGAVVAGGDDMYVCRNELLAQRLDGSQHFACGSDRVGPRFLGHRDRDGRPFTGDLPISWIAGTEAQSHE